MFQVDWMFGLLNRKLTGRKMVLSLRDLTASSRQALREENLQGKVNLNLIQKLSLTLSVHSSGSKGITLIKS